MTWSVRTLGPDSLHVFAELVERDNGVHGGCWCTAFHSADPTEGQSTRTTKQELVRRGGARAALVLDEDGLAQGWTQHGDVEELRFRHRRV